MCVCVCADISAERIEGNGTTWKIYAADNDFCAKIYFIDAIYAFYRAATFFLRFITNWIIPYQFT